MWLTTFFLLYPPKVYGVTEARPYTPNNIFSFSILRMTPSTPESCCSPTIILPNDMLKSKLQHVLYSVKYYSPSLCCVTTSINFMYSTSTYCSPFSTLSYASPLQTKLYYGCYHPPTPHHTMSFQNPTHTIPPCSAIHLLPIVLCTMPCLPLSLLDKPHSLLSLG